MILLNERRYNDGIRNAMDRWYGPRGVAMQENALYVYQQNGMDVLREIRPGEDELKEDNKLLYGSQMLGM